MQKLKHFLLLSTNTTPECLRDLGLEDAALQVAVRGEVFQSMRWCRSLNEDEYGRVRGWSEHPSCRVSLLGYTMAMPLTMSMMQGEVENLSPCKHAEFPQSELEPLLVKTDLNARAMVSLLRISLPVREYWKGRE